MDIETEAKVIIKGDSLVLSLDLNKILSESHEIIRQHAVNPEGVTIIVPKGYTLFGYPIKVRMEE